MSSKDLYKRGDSAPAFEREITSLHRDLEDATARFRLETPDGENLAVNDEMTIVSPSESKVRYEWQEGDLQAAGRYKGDIQIEWSDGEKRHIPTGSNYYYIQVGEPIDSELDPAEWENKDITVGIATADEVHTDLLSVGNSPDVTGISEGAVEDGTLVGGDYDAEVSSLENKTSGLNEDGSEADLQALRTDKLNNADFYVGPDDNLESVISEDVTIALLPGVHEYEGIEIPATGNLTFRGYGKRQTVVEAPDDATDPVFVAESTTERVKGVEFKHLTIDGREQDVNGIDFSPFDDGMDECSFEHVKIENCDRGIEGSQNDREAVKLENCIFDDNTVGYYVNYNHPDFDNCVFRRNSTGIGGDPYHMKVTNCHFSRNSIGMRGMNDGSIDQTRIYNTRFTFNFDTDLILGEGNSVDNCQFNAGQEDVNIAVRLEGNENQFGSPFFERTPPASYDYLFAADGQVAPSHISISNPEVQRTSSTFLGVVDTGDGDLSQWSITGGTVHIEDDQWINIPDAHSFHHYAINGVVFRFQGGIGTDSMAYLGDCHFGGTMSGNRFRASGSDFDFALDMDAPRSTAVVGNTFRNCDYNLRNTEETTEDVGNSVSGV